VTNCRLRLEGPAALARRVATALDDADGVELISSDQPITLRDSRVALNVTVEAAFNAVADAVANIAARSRPEPRSRSPAPDEGDRRNGPSLVPMATSPSASDGGHQPPIMGWLVLGPDLIRLDDRLAAEMGADEVREPPWVEALETVADLVHRPPAVGEVVLVLVAHPQCAVD